MEEIISRSNKKIKMLKKLSLKKYRRKFKLFKVENAKVIKSASEAGIKYKEIYLTREFVGRNNGFLLEKDANLFLVPEVVNRSFSDLDTAPGICGVYEFLDKPANFALPIVYLNGVSDPGNLGTILRSALAFGFGNLVLDGGCADIYSPKVLQASKDAIFKIKFSLDRDGELFDKIKAAMPVYSTRPKDAADVSSIDFDKRFCLVLGSESRGVSPIIREMADNFIKIGISGSIESLNVAVAASILFYEISKKK